jgi:hypothetical protein
VILGHANASTTQQIYTHVDEAAKLDALTRLNRLLGATMTDRAVVSSGGQRPVRPVTPGSSCRWSLGDSNP